MIGYATVGCSDVPRGRVLYAAVFEIIGAQLVVDTETICVWQFDNHMFGILRPSNGEPATFGNGTMIGIDARDRARVRAVYQAALALGAKDEGAPTFRAPFPEGAVFSGYFRDFDGNKIAIFCSAREGDE